MVPDLCWLNLKMYLFKKVLEKLQLLKLCNKHFLHTG